MRHAAAYWRGLSKEGKSVDARIINTSSGAGLQGSVGQGNYSAAKAGIAAITLVAAAEMGRYGVTVNAIAPSARTRMTETVFADMMAKPDEGFDAMAPENISPLVVWLGSAQSRDVTGRVFEVEGGIVRVAEGWAHGPQVDKGARWDPAELGPVVADLAREGTPAGTGVRRLIPFRSCALLFRAAAAAVPVLFDRNSFRVDTEADQLRPFAQTALDFREAGKLVNAMT